MIRPSKGQTNAAHPGILERAPVRAGPQGPPLRAGGRPDPAADLRRHAQARRPAPAGAGAGGEARRRTQLRPRRSPHSGGDGHPRAEAGPWHRGPRSVDRLAGGPARQRPHAQARDGGRAAGRAPDHRAGAGGARRAQRDRRGDRGAGGDPSPPGAEDASRRAGHRGGLAVPLRAGARGPQQRPAESARRADGSLAREPRPLVAGPRPARALVRRPPAHPAGDQAPRRQGGGEGSEPALERDRGSPDASALTKVEMDRLFAVEIVYRGIFQKKLAAHKEGKPGISFGRYGDSPERNGIPAKYFAIVATDETTLEEGKAKYEPKGVDISICVDDTLFKGVESWAWYGLQPINKLLKPGGTLIVTSLKEADQLIPLAHRKQTAYKLAVLKGTPSFSGLWVYKDDHTDVRILGAMARVLPELFSLGSVQETIRDEWKNELKATSALRAFERVTTVTVTPDQANPTEQYKFEMPKWTEMRDGIAIPGIPLGGQMKDPVTGEEGGWRPGRNDTFKKWDTRTMRPVVDFDKCIKCTLCWLQCPDSVFDVTPEGLYDANLEACCGCGVCEAVCPVTACVTMVNETQFTDNASQWEAWRTDKPAYEAHLAEWIKDRPERSHGFRFRGQYQQELPNEFARQG